MLPNGRVEGPACLSLFKQVKPYYPLKNWNINQSLICSYYSLWCSVVRVHSFSPFLWWPLGHQIQTHSLKHSCNHTSLQYLHSFPCSPLCIHSRKLCRAITVNLGDKAAVAAGQTAHPRTAPLQPGHWPGLSTVGGFTGGRTMRVQGHAGTVGVNEGHAARKSKGT